MYLLDTHVLLWVNTAPELLPARAREAVESKQIKASVVSLWELILKKSRREAPVRDPVEWWDRYIVRPSIEVLPVRTPHVAQLDRLPDLHKDPFDRMLVAQAQYEKLWIVTADTIIARYAQTVW